MVGGAQVCAGVGVNFVCRLKGKGGEEGEGVCVCGAGPRTR